MSSTSSARRADSHEPDKEYKIKDVIIVNIDAMIQLVILKARGPHLQMLISRSMVTTSVFRRTSASGRWPWKITVENIHNMHGQPQETEKSPKS